MIDVRVTGADQAAAVARALKEAGDRGLRRDAMRALNSVTKPLRADMKASAGRTLPQRGGLAARAARTGLTTTLRAGRDPGVRIRAGRNTLKDPSSLDRGRIRHPVFGHEPLVFQRIRPGAFDRPFEAGAPRVRHAVVGVLDDTANRIARA